MHASRGYNLWGAAQWEAAVRSVLNVPDAAVAAGQHWARSVDRARHAETHIEVLESYVDYLEGVEQMADAFGTALGAVPACLESYEAPATCRGQVSGGRFRPMRAVC